jgi:hypothetical protein
MSEEPTDLSAFTQKLAEVRPDAGQLQRDAILFAAGVAAGRRSGHWPKIAVSMAVLAAGLGATLLFRPPTEVKVEVERVVLVQVPVPEPESPISVKDEPVPPPTSDFSEGLRQRERFLRGDGGTLVSEVWAPLPTAAKPNDVPSLSALRLNAKPKLGE